MSARPVQDQTQLKLTTASLSTENFFSLFSNLDRWFIFLIINILCLYGEPALPRSYRPMKKQLVLTVPIEQITWEGIDIPVSLDADWFAPWLKEQPGLEFSLEKPITGTVRLERHDDSILVRGQLQGELIFTCSRCLDAFTGPLAATFDLLLKASRPPVSDQDVELNPEDLDEDYLLGDELDLNALLQEQILLALPLKPLCLEDCLGLCRQCGANLNREKCSCAAPAFYSSFAALEKLKND
jgi:uncharacterized protein